MRALSPVEALQPAWEHTRAILFRPFRLGRSWKLALCGYLALWGSVFFPLPLLLVGVPTSGASTAAAIGLPLLGVALSLVLFAFYYLGSRMQLVLFDLILSQEKFIAPLWRRRSATLIWRWIAVKLAIGLPLCALLFLPLLSLIHRVILLAPRAFPAATPGAAPPPPPDPALFFTICATYALLAAAFALLAVVSSLLSDFILPFLALEGCTIRSAFARATRLFREQPGTLLGFVAFQVLIAVIGLAAQYAVGVAATLILGIPLGLLALLGWALLHATASTLVLFSGAAALEIVFFCGAMYVQFASFGVVMIFLWSLSLHFLTGRIPSLGAALAPPPPPLVSPSEATLPPGALPSS